MSAFGTSQTFEGTAQTSGLRSKAEAKVPAQAAQSGGGRIRANLRNNPTRSKFTIHPSRKCGARTRTGNPCKSPAMPNGRCRMHGGKSPGAPKGNRNAWKHGHYSAQSIALRKQVRQLLSVSRETVERC